MILNNQPLLSLYSRHPLLTRHTIKGAASTCAGCGSDTSPEGQGTCFFTLPFKKGKRLAVRKGGKFDFYQKRISSSVCNPKRIFLLFLLCNLLEYGIHDFAFLNLMKTFNLVEKATVYVSFYFQCTKQQLPYTRLGNVPRAGPSTIPCSNTVQYAL